MRIRTRLTLWNFLIMLIVLLTFNFILFFGMKLVFYRTLDEEINIFADNIEESYNPIIGEFEEIFWRLESAKRYNELYLIVYNSAGSPIFATPMTQLVRLEIPKIEKNVIQEGYTIKTNTSQNSQILKPNPEGEVTFRVIVRKMYYDNYLIGYLQAALPIENVETTLQQLLNTILIANLIIVIFIAAAGYFLTGKMLNPIQIIIRKAKKISQSNLDDRIVVKNQKDELGQLSRTLNELLRRLQESFESQRAFMADAAHELKTPLAVLRTHWESELNNPDINEELKEKMVKDVETISRLSRMINNLLLLSQSEIKYGAFEFDNIRLDSVIEEVVSNLEVLAGLKTQTLTISELDEVEINGDRTKIYQLFFNLVENAIKYTQAEGIIKISVLNENRMAVVKVSDNGTGIPAEDLPKIFDRFYRVDKDRARKSGGSGLGLAICKLIAEAHNGSIEVKSSLGTGTVFIVKMPINSKIEKKDV